MTLLKEWNVFTLKRWVKIWVPKNFLDLKMIRSLNNLKEQMCASWEDESQAESQKLLRTSTRRQPNSQNLYTIQRINSNFKISVIAMIHLSTVYNFSCSIFDSLIWSSDDSWLWSFQRKLQILLDRSWHFTGRMNQFTTNFKHFFAS